ncbi:DUF3310 domain-containing protein [Streptomyces klenkii]|uniref:DUF3310 domain-containing protein n=1 Tax=Streptomyces klenkii TaxID=1420899 RepID=UPI00340138EC
MSLLYKDKRGVIQAIHEGHRYPNDVVLNSGGALCFTDDELMPVREPNPGQRLLSETQGFSIGVDAFRAQELMRKAFRELPQRDASAVNRPNHYTSHPSGIECIEITQHMNFPLGNAVKYLWRAGLKGDVVEDLKKARRYIDIEIQRLEEAA